MKTIANRILYPTVLVPFLAFVIACQPHQQNSPSIVGAKVPPRTAVLPALPAPPPEQELGGISAGGGGTLPANPIGVYQVIEILGGAKRELRLFLNSKRRYSPGEFTLSQDKYYFGVENLATQLEKTDIEILSDRPCKDKFNNDVDASIHASLPNTICFSAFRVAPKLVRETANKEILALLIHELSHFLGADEKEAVDLQQSAAWLLEEVSWKYADELESKTWMHVDEVDSLHSYKDSIYSEIDKKDTATLRKDLADFYKKLEQTSSLFEQLPLSFLDFTAIDYQRIVAMKVEMALTYLDSISGSESDRKAFRDYYEECFNGQSSVKVRELLGHCTWGIYNSLYPDYEVSRLTSLEQLKPYLADVFLFSYDLAGHIRAIAFDQPLPYFNLPTNSALQNPWEHFVGKYRAEAIECSSNSPNKFNSFEGLTAIALAKETLNYPAENQKSVSLTLQFDGRSGTDSLFNGGYGSGAVKVSGDAKRAEVTDERGTRWYDRQRHGWSKTTKVIERTSSGLVFILRRESFRLDYQGTSEGSFQCKYKLIPVD